MILIDHQRRVIDSNKAAVDVLGTVRKGEDLSLTIHHPELLEIIDVVLGGESIVSTETTLPHPVMRTFEITATRLTPQTAGVVEREEPVLLVLHDITVIRASEVARSDFIANVSHELRSPLVSLMGFIETIQTSAKDDPAMQDRFMTIMEGEAARMKALIDDLLSLSKIEANEHIRPDGEVDLPQVLASVAQPLAQKAEHKSMSIEITHDPGIKLVPGDEQELVQIFTNLIDNGVKYGRENTSVIVACSRVPQIPDIGTPGICVTVTNHGDPIAAEHLPRLTQRFYRIDKGRSRSVGGTGLGLAIVKHLVNHHRGRLTIQSDETAGTTFSVYLPCPPASQPAERPAS